MAATEPLNASGVFVAVACGDPVPSRNWPAGSTHQWRKTRKTVLDRDRYRCQLTIPAVCTVIADCVHHTGDRAVTGDNPAYLVAACTPCNQHVGDPVRARGGGAARDPDPVPRTSW